jgi:hypothetical protein
MFPSRNRNTSSNSSSLISVKRLSVDDTIRPSKPPDGTSASPSRAPSSGPHLTAAVTPSSRTPTPYSHVHARPATVSLFYGASAVAYALHHSGRRQILPGWWAAGSPDRRQSPRWDAATQTSAWRTASAGPLALLSITMRRGVTVDGHDEAIQAICALFDGAPATALRCAGQKSSAATNYAAALSHGEGRTGHRGVTAHPESRVPSTSPPWPLATKRKRDALSRPLSAASPTTTNSPLLGFQPLEHAAKQFGCLG